jgi:twitching motility protein PilT
VSVFRQRGDLAIVLRQIPNKLLTFEQIGLPEIVPRPDPPSARLFLVTGPTGSGKTTSLATMIDYINTNDGPPHRHDGRPDRVLPQPQEVDRQPARSGQRRAELRRGPPPRAASGPGRDPGGRNARPGDDRAAIRAAETGHLVFGTLHTTGAAKTIDRIVDAFPVNQQNQIRVQLSTGPDLRPEPGAPAAGRKPGMVAAYEFLVVTPPSPT